MLTSGNPDLPAPNKKPFRHGQEGFFVLPGKPGEIKARLHALDLFQHLENALGRIHEKTLERLAKAPALQGIAAHALTFGHG
jgi:hypothetical protein